MKSQSSERRSPSCAYVIAGGPDSMSLGSDALDLEPEVAAALQQRRDQVLDDLLLSVDRHVPAGQLGDLDVLGVALPAQVDAVVLEPLAGQPLADPQVVHQLDRVLLEQAGADAPLDVVAVAVLEDHRLDARSLQQQPEHQPRGTCSDDADLRVYVRGSPCRLRAVTRRYTMSA